MTSSTVTAPRSLRWHPLLLALTLVATAIVCASPAASSSLSSALDLFSPREAPEFSSASALALQSDAQHLLGAIPCSWDAPDGTHFDFSGLTTPTGTQFAGKQSDVYNINICGVAQGDGGKGQCVQNSATLCFQFTWSPDWFAIAENQNTGNPAPTYSLVTPGQSSQGVALTFHNGAYGPNPATVLMQFYCTTTPTAYTAAHDGTDHWSVTISSPEACPQAAPSGGGGGGKHGLSGGWIFIILLIVFSVVYVAGGCAFKHFRQGTQGMESCPNVDFWRGFPGLIKDGCVYFFGLCKQGVAKCRGGGGGGGSSSDSYASFK